MTSEVRAFLPIDLPLVHRLTPHGVSLDTAISLTRGLRTVGSAVWSTFPLTDLGTPTLVLRNGDREYVAQFRHKIGEPHAHIVFIAPDVDYCQDESGWLALIDAMAIAAGKRGAFTLNAEVGETSTAFVVLRQCGFAVYARQEIWQRLPAPLAQFETAPSCWREEAESDRSALEALYASVVPRSIWQVDSLPEATRGLVCEMPDGQISGYVALQEGRTGICGQMVMRPELSDEPEMGHGWLGLIPRAERLPLYVCVRRYQSWLHGTLSDLGFTVWDSQALLVKHTVARIERPLLKSVRAFDVAVATAPAIGPARPRVRRITPRVNIPVSPRR